MSSYAVIDGDTYDLIARKLFGEQSRASLLRASNPGIVEPLAQGTLLNIPADPNAPQDLSQQLTSNNPAQVTIVVTTIVDGTKQSKQFTFWESISIKRQIDSLSTIALTAPFNADDEDMRTFFRPFSFQEITVSIGGNTFFKGTIVNITPRLTESRSIVEITAYSLPGIMTDCQQPASDFPLAWEQYTLKEIADDISAVFGIRAVFDNPPGDVFQAVTSSPEATALSFLTDLAKQRNLVIGDTREGELLFQESTPVGFPRARLTQGNSPLVSVTPRFNAQETFSTVTGINTIQPGVEGSSFTVQTGILGGRYHTFKVKDTLNTSLELAVNAKVGRMYGNMASFNCSLATWFDPFGSLWTPNTTVKLFAPNAMVYEEYEFVIRSVELQRTADSEAARIDLVLPGAFSGEIPASLPWE